MSDLHRKLSRAYMTIALLDLVIAYLGWQGGHPVVAIPCVPLAVVAGWAAFLHWTDAERALKDPS